MNKQLTHGGADTLVATATITTGGGDEWLLNYYIQQFVGTEELKDIPLYGLRIDKSTPDGVLAEREETLAVTENHALIMEMAQAFAKGQVTPVVLLEMTDDWLQC